MTTKIQDNCPVCGASIPEEAPGGLCPQCVLQNAETIANASGTGGGFVAPPSIEEISPHFPDLEILELIGVGGMGAVYKARQRNLDRIVALKILSSQLAKDPAFVERFNREARVLARLSHPHIVGVFEFGSDGAYCYLLMEYIDGVNLRQAMRTGGFTPNEALSLVQDVCAALQFAHEEGVASRATTQVQDRTALDHVWDRRTATVETGQNFVFDLGENGLVAGRYVVRQAACVGLEVC